MITQHIDRYWTNKYGRRFCSEQEAVEDEARRDHIPYQIKIIGVPQDRWEDSYGAIFSQSVEAIDDSKAPSTGQPNGRCRVFLLKPIIERMQRLVDKHGDNVGYTTHHCGMGINSTELCLLLDNPKID